MRILLVYNGMASAVRKHLESLPSDLKNLSTTHMSEVNYLMISYWLEKLGNTVSVLSEGPRVVEGKSGDFHFPVVSVGDADPSLFDVLLIFKVHGLRVANQNKLLHLPWKRIATWLDCPCPETVLGDDVGKINIFAWGTQEILETEARRFPRVTHALCEHATVFNERPLVSAQEPYGLYAGRLPRVYLDQVISASSVAAMRVFGLWIETGGKKILLRPYQYKEEELLAARSRMPVGTLLEPGVNMIAKSTDVSRTSFGLCPACMIGAPQVLSASKFYDYAALGLPTVLADNTPEARHVRSFPVLGELYKQGDERSLHEAIKRAMSRMSAGSRKEIQDWTFSNATYRKRAGAIHELLNS